ncbi:MAG: hypothetical protein HC788_09350 [Sphingopyxis sp.]|nr:hypothetical protein [Sphingopyxis sp.]
MTEKKLYAIVRCERLKTWSDLIEASRHNVRDQRVSSTIEGRPPPIELIPRGPISVAQHAKRTLNSLGLKPDPAKVTAVEYVISASPEWFHGIDPKMQQDWVDCNLAFLRKKHGPGLISATLHLDESTPHIHAICLPVYKDIVRKRGAKPATLEGEARRKKEELEAPKVWRQSYDRVMGSGRCAFRDLQTSYHRAVEHFGLARGEDSVGQGKRHTPLKEYREQLDARQTKLDNQEAELIERRERLARAEAELEFRVLEFTRDVGLLENEQAAAQSRRDQLALAEATAAQREIEIQARAKKLSDVEQATKRQAADLTLRENDLAGQQIALAKQMADHEVQFRLLRRHADPREPLSADSAAVAKTPDERRVAATTWSEPMRLIKSLILHTRRSRQRLAILFQRMRARLVQVRTRELAVAKRTALLDAQSAVIRRREQETITLHDKLEARERAMRNTALETEALQHRTVEQRAEVSKREEAVLGAEKNLLSVADDLSRQKEMLVQRRTALDAEHQKTVQERIDQIATTAELKRREEALVQAKDQHWRDFQKLEHEKSTIELDTTRIDTAKAQAQAERKLLHDVVSGRLEVKFVDERLLFKRADGWAEATVNYGRPVSENTLAVVRLAVSAQSMRAAAQIAGDKLQDIAAEIETLRPERKQQLDVQKSGIAAAMAQLDKSEGR